MTSIFQMKNLDMGHKGSEHCSLDLSRDRISNQLFPTSRWLIFKNTVYKKLSQAREDVHDSFFFNLDITSSKKEATLYKQHNIN